MKKFIKWALWGIFAIAVITTFGYLWKKGQPEEIKYQILTPTEGDSITKQLVLTGTINPRDEVAIKPQIAGIVSEVLVEPGQQVKVGDVLARISVVPEVSQLNNAETNLQQTKISHDKLKAIYIRDRELHEKGLIATEDYERSRAEYETAKTQLASAQDAMQIVRSGVSGRFSKESSTQVRATRAGTVLSVPVKVGSSVIQANNFNEGTTIATIANMQDLVFYGNADETEVGRLSTGQSMVISVGALPNIKLNATVEYISPQGFVENGTTRYQIRGALIGLASEVIAQLRSGYSANAEITTDRALKVLTIPEAAISYRSDSTFVHIVKSEDPFVTEERPIIVGISDGSKSEVKKGLKTGEKIRGNQIIANN